jgi:translocation and assembly module TamB
LQRLEVVVSESSAQIGRGRAKVNAEVCRDANGLRLSGNLNLLDADLRHLVSAASEVTSYAQGQVSMRVEFAGSNVRSLNDLTADIDGTLHQVQARQMPGLSLLVPFLGPGAGNSTFQDGDLKARLGAGVIRVQRLGLAGTYLALVLEGNITLQGRLDLDVSARTGSLLGIDPLLLRVLSLRIPPVGPLPIALILRTSELLANQVVHLRLTGTVKNPQVEAQPVRLLSDTATRFFLASALLGR